MSSTHGTWGERHRVWQSDTALATVLYLEPWKRCSWHHHDRAFNLFFVVRGALAVKTERGYTTFLTEKQGFEVEPGIAHEFQTGEARAVVFEMAFGKYNPDDILRASEGGDLPEEERKLWEEWLDGLKIGS